MPTRWYKLKTNESASELPVEPEVLELFRGWRARATSEFVIESDRLPKFVDYQHYRCEEVFAALHAASSGLRHADIRTTSAFYADRRVKVTPGFGQPIPALQSGALVPFSGEGKIDQKATRQN